MRLIVRPEAESELLRCIDASFQRVLRNPELYPVVHRGIRMAIVRRFPYLVLYRLGDESISVIAVFHAKRDPKIWKSR